jgi:hypothetical protein
MTLVLWRTNTMIQIQLAFLTDHQWSRRPHLFKSSQLEEDFRSDAEDLRQMLRSRTCYYSQAATLICLLFVDREGGTTQSVKDASADSARLRRMMAARFINNFFKVELTHLDILAPNLPNWSIINLIVSGALRRVPDSQALSAFSSFKLAVYQSTFLVN